MFDTKQIELDKSGFMLFLAQVIEKQNGETTLKHIMQYFNCTRKTASIKFKEWKKEGIATSINNPIDPREKIILFKEKKVQEYCRSIMINKLKPILHTTLGIHPDAWDVLFFWSDVLSETEKEKVMSPLV